MSKGLNIRAIDCQGLAGAFTYGVAQAGWDVLGKLELPGAFGMDNVQKNKHLISDDHIHFQVGPWEEWEVIDAELVFGNPPCSGFSLLNTSNAGRNPDKVNVRNHRGWDSPINDCMWALIEYAGRVKPFYVAMESVQGAYKQGRILMQKLRDKLELLTGDTYELTHLLVSGSSLGNPQRRHRYYMILRSETRAPRFSIDIPDPMRPLTYRDAFYDLKGMDIKWEAQPYRWSTDNAYALSMRSPDALVDSHVTLGPEAGTKHPTQTYALLENKWEVGWNMDEACQVYYKEHGELPAGFNKDRIADKIERYEGHRDFLKAKTFHLGFHQPRRVPWDKEGYVVTGSGGLDFIHPDEDRFLTVREVARLQGFPDAWTFSAAQRPQHAYAWIGKGVPAQVGQWVGEQLKKSLIWDGGGEDGEEIGDRERLIDITYAWRG